MTARAKQDEDRLARFVLDRVLSLRPGDHVTVETWSHALPWARSLVVEARRRRADPTLVVEDEEAFFRSLSLPSARRLPAPSAALADSSDAYVYLAGPEAFQRLFGLAATELESVLARHDMAWARAARRARLRAVRLLIAGATPAAAARYGVEPATWRRDLVRASLVPPEQLARAADRLRRRLARARRLRIRHPNGTDISVELEPNRAVVEIGQAARTHRPAGRIWTQLPTGVAAVPLVAGFAEGVWEANRPSYDRFANPPVSEGARFVFARGRLREYSLDRGGRAFAATYARGGRGRDVPGALTFGLNPAIGRVPEVEELAVDAIGLALGGNRAVGGRNRSRFSYLSVLRGAEVEVEGTARSAAARRSR